MIKSALIALFFLPILFTPTVKASSVYHEPTTAGVAEGSQKAKTTSNEIGWGEMAPVNIGPIVASTFTNNPYPWGQCVFYAYSRHPVPFLANGGDWYWEAAAYGLPHGTTPRAGAVMVSAESYLGHVAIVESVNPDGSFWVSEMHHPILGVVDTRLVTSSNTPIIGFLY